MLNVAKNTWHRMGEVTQAYLAYSTRACRRAAEFQPNGQLPNEPKGERGTFSRFLEGGDSQQPIFDQFWFQFPFIFTAI